MGLDDFAPAEPANDTGTDEDLFDFPPMEQPKASEAGDESAPSEDAAQASAPAPQTVCTGLDPELDEDLFGFPPMDLSSLGIATSETPDAGLEGTIDKAAQQVSDLLEDDLGDIVREASEEESTASASPVETPQPAPQQAAPAQEPVHEPKAAEAPPEPRKRVREQAAAAAPAPVAIATPVAVTSTSPRALWVLTAGILMFMVGILTIAWRATSVFQQQIQAVRQDVATSATNLRDSTTESIKELAELERELLRNQVAAAKEGRDSEKVYKGLEIQAPHEVILQVATEAIADGSYPEARQMLFNLLAEADNHPADIRLEMERRANTLIAQSFKDQAEAMPGGDE